MRRSEPEPPRSPAGPAPAGAQAKEASKAVLDRLLRQCDVETYRGSGPGGQHRNRRDSAVRLTHRPTGLVATASERRSQHQNKLEALRRMQAKLAARLRRRKKRFATEPTTGARARRVEEKKRRGHAKTGRKRPSIED